MDDPHINLLLDYLAELWNQHIDLNHPGCQVADDHCQTCRRLSRSVYELLRLDDVRKAS